MSKRKDKKPEKIRMDVIIGNNIRLERELRNFGRDELAEMLGVSVSHMGLIERGERGTTAVTLAVLSRIFDIPIDHLFSSSQEGGLSVHDVYDKETLINRRKIHGLITALNNAELEHIIYTIKGVVALSYSLLNTPPSSTLK